MPTSNPSTDPSRLTPAALNPTALTPTPQSVSDIAASARADRNRAVDLYRAVAMVAVAIGHWLAIAISAKPEGGVTGGNALEQAPQMAWFSWILQVMPLFFVVGGFSSAMSLDAHTDGVDGTPGRPQDWVAARLRRMVAPAIVLATLWLFLVAAGYAVGLGGMVAAGATAAAIPLWFLSNYTIDTALAPYVLPRFRANPARFALLGLGAFVAIEVLRLAGVAWIPWINWVLGWLLFQVAGFAWRDGLLPTGRRLAAYAGLFWVGALSVVAFGPYPTSMVNVPGLEHSPTQPPTIALLLFGAAYSATALVFAPAITRYLARSRRAWALVVAANSFALSVYLWHMTAAVAASAVFYGFGALPTAPVGTSSWWVQKVPLLALSLVFLVGIVAVVSRVERKALFAPRSPWRGGQLSMLIVAGLLSVGVKLWAGGEVESVALGCAILLAVWHGKLSATERRRRTSSVLTGSYRG